ncbi:hypothetical protein A2316_01630 [Candidatus Falkowbacteria bacterium RIFOXYB2_FULL_38_15]|uniref:ECF transporter S component n=1 Tax=Candidatus Falkowbacteria bacterium RIFOXYA2_FULL_38_12 TaxID=1797993 RepID=A0A1F5S1D7_9BACT|nr:MAG: hypothetical protein A2257_04060 [Candidatus Falkowbacteria bacterium RIFOXYA2_FULL_38_12]OGF32936.1 MAG: hypothetical protein A2316_01630 [Candidatus Falkowbacteria bacterium RIFOXYB2_FULL_38_15]OGF44110.1 MAG: hypothetical protein A2555_01830 [Candidatus Falkowbacteria bacterium RIFOXYD2_FULL_39_16]
MKNIKDYFNKKNILFIVIFAVIGLIALQVPVAQIVGSKTKFTLFDFFGPVASGFIGLVPGIIAIFLMQLANFLIHGANVIDPGTIIKFFPMLFAALYFAKKGKANIIIPAIAIVAFISHPIGRQAWYYSMYWLIPIVCYFLRDKSLLGRSLGTTFTAHAVGSTLYLYVFGLSKAIWTSLIPVVAMERILFAFGIMATYLVFNNVLNILVEKKWVKLEFLVDKKYVWAGLLSRLS